MSPITKKIFLFTAMATPFVLAACSPISSAPSTPVKQNALTDLYASKKQDISNSLYKSVIKYLAGNPKLNIKSDLANVLINNAIAKNPFYNPVKLAPIDTGKGAFEFSQGGLWYRSPLDNPSIDKAIDAAGNTFVNYPNLNDKDIDSKVLHFQGIALSPMLEDDSNKQVLNYKYARFNFQQAGQVFFKYLTEALVQLDLAIRNQDWQSIDKTIDEVAKNYGYLAKLQSKVDFAKFDFQVPTVNKVPSFFSHFPYVGEDNATRQRIQQEATKDTINKSTYNLANLSAQTVKSNHIEFSRSNLYFSPLINTRLSYAKVDNHYDKASERTVDLFGITTGTVLYKDSDQIFILTVAHAFPDLIDNNSTFNPAVGTGQIVSDSGILNVAKLPPSNFTFTLDKTRSDLLLIQISTKGLDKTEVDNFATRADNNPVIIDFASNPYYFNYYGVSHGNELENAKAVALRMWDHKFNANASYQGLNNQSIWQYNIPWNLENHKLTINPPAWENNLVKFDDTRPYLIEHPEHNWLISLSDFSQVDQSKKIATLVRPSNWMFYQGKSHTASIVSSNLMGQIKMFPENHLKSNVLLVKMPTVIKGDSGSALLKTVLHIKTEANQNLLDNFGFSVNANNITLSSLLAIKSTQYGYDKIRGILSGVANQSAPLNINAVLAANKGNSGQDADSNKQDWYSNGETKDQLGYIEVFDQNNFWILMPYLDYLKKIISNDKNQS